MQTGVFMEAHVGKLLPCILHLVLLIHLSLAAPGLPGSQREESADAHPPFAALPNPFGTGEEDRRLLQSYVLSSLTDGQGGPEISTWEQEVFFLFRLYDYDRSGLLDGLEMMKLLSDFNSHHTPGAPANDLVVSMVDFLLQTQDLNQDGLLAPSELLSPSLPHTQGQEVAVEEKLSNPNADEEKAAAPEQRDEAHGEAHKEIQEEDQPQHEVKAEEEEVIKQIDEQNGQQPPEAPAADQGHYQEVPVHQGQPEI